MREPNHEKGQVLVIFAVALVGLIGFMALAIDGGMIFSDRRIDQNVADSVAMAGAAKVALVLENNAIHYKQFWCPWPQDYSATCAFSCGADANNAPMPRNCSMCIGRIEAKQRATESGFTVDANLDNENGIEVTCHNDPMGAVFDRYIDVHTMISTDVATSFAHLVFPGLVRNTVESLLRVHPRNTVAFGFAIVSLNPNCDPPTNGMEFDGNSQVTVHGGGIFSNACLTMNGGINVSVDPPSEGIGYNNSYAVNGGSGTIIPAPDHNADEIPPRTVDAPDCSTVPAMGNVTVHNSDNITLDPGRYGSIRQTGGTLTLNPGLYCVSNGLETNGGMLTGDGVTIYLTGGDFSTGANVEVNLEACFDEPEDCYPALAGMLVFLAHGHGGDVELQGNALSSLMGTVYAPNGHIEAGGSSSMMPTMNTQLVGWDVKVHGGTNLDINFDTALNYSSPSMLDMQR